jgi:DNA-binding PadR family transcriptional regulator
MTTDAAPPRLRRPNDPSVLILTSLAEGPKHGYALARDIAAFAGVTLSPGTLYGAITRLEESGLIVAQPEIDRRRPYAITAEGAAALSAVLSDMSRLAQVGSTRLRGLRALDSSDSRPWRLA